MDCARGVFVPPRAFFVVGRAFFLSVGQDRLILPDGDQAIAIYRGLPRALTVGAVFNRACMDCARGIFCLSRAFFFSPLPDGDQAIAIYRGLPRALTVGAVCHRA